jgi:hypothetical protein
MLFRQPKLFVEGMILKIREINSTEKYAISEKEANAFKTYWLNAKYEKLPHVSDFEHWFREHRSQNKETVTCEYHKCVGNGWIYTQRLINGEPYQVKGYDDIRLAKLCPCVKGLQWFERNLNRTFIYFNDNDLRNRSEKIFRNALYSNY